MSVKPGICVVTTTPFTKERAIDFDGVAKNLKWLVGKKVHSILVTGALGEYSTLSIEERKELVKFGLEVIQNSVDVIVGTTASRPDHVIELTNHAQQHGAKAVMILPPPGASLSDQEIFSYYEYICNNISCPVMVYNNPYSSGMDINLELLERIVSLPNIFAIKESSGDIKRLSYIHEKIRSDFMTFCGWEDMCYEAFCVGTKGCVAMGGNYFPDILLEMYEKIQNNHYDEAWELYKRYLPIARYLENGGKVVQTCKYIMDKMGLVGGYTRLPKQPLTEEEKTRIDKILTNYNV